MRARCLWVCLVIYLWLRDRTIWKETYLDQLFKMIGNQVILGTSCLTKLRSLHSCAKIYETLPPPKKIVLLLTISLVITWHILFWSYHKSVPIIAGKERSIQGNSVHNLPRPSVTTSDSWAFLSRSPCPLARLHAGSSAQWVLTPHPEGGLTLWQRGARTSPRLLNGLRESCIHET